MKNTLRRKKTFFFTLAFIVIAAAVVVKRYSAPPAPLERIAGESQDLADAEKTGLEAIAEKIREKKYLESEVLLNDFLKAKHPKEEKYEARFLLAYVYLSLGQWRKAFVEFKLVATASPPHKRSPDATYMAAELLDRQFGEPEKAREYYEKYVDKWPQGRLARRAMAKIVRK